jgi:hypothetical protein
LFLPILVLKKIIIRRLSRIVCLALFSDSSLAFTRTDFIFFLWMHVTALAVIPPLAAVGAQIPAAPIDANIIAILINIIATKRLVSILKESSPIQSFLPLTFTIRFAR